MITEKYFNSNFEEPDYNSNIFMVPKHKRYCWANFLHYILNSKDNIDENQFLFTDYRPSNSLKYELSKIYKMRNSKFYQTNENRKLLELRMKSEWDPKIRMYFTNSTLHYNLEIGKNFLCPFQMYNHAPGHGCLSRPDLMADIMAIDKGKNRTKEIKKCLKLSSFYPHTIRLYKKQECERFFKESSSKVYLSNLKNHAKYIRKQVQQKKLLKIDFLEDHNLKTEYNNGSECGIIKNKDLIQTNINKQLTYEDKRKFKLRYFQTFASFKPLVVYYENGYALLEKTEEKESFMDLMINIDDMATYFYKHQMVSSVEWFKENFRKKSEDVSRKLVYLTRDKFLEDGRLFQIFALDFIMDTNFNIWLTDIKYNPNYSLKNKELVENIQQRQFKILDHRNHLVFDKFQEIKNDTEDKIKKGLIKLDSNENFEKGLKNKLNFEKINNELKNQTTSYPDDISEENMIFDERKGKNISDKNEKLKAQFLGKLDLSCMK